MRAQTTGNEPISQVCEEHVTAALNVLSGEHIPCQGLSSVTKNSRHACDEELRVILPSHLDGPVEAIGDTAQAIEKRPSSPIDAITCHHEPSYVPLTFHGRSSSNDKQQTPLGHNVSVMKTLGNLMDKKEYNFNETLHKTVHYRNIGTSTCDLLNDNNYDNTISPLSISHCHISGIEENMLTLCSVSEPCKLNPIMEHQHKCQTPKSSIERTYFSEADDQFTARGSVMLPTQVITSFSKSHEMKIGINETREFGIEEKPENGRVFQPTVFARFEEDESVPMTNLEIDQFEKGPTIEEEKIWAEKLSAIRQECERLLREGNLLKERNTTLKNQVIYQTKIRMC